MIWQDGTKKLNEIAKGKKLVTIKHFFLNSFGG